MIAPIFAVFPLVLILVLMAGLRWGAAKAGVAGWLAALLIAWLRFGAGLGVLLVAQARSLLLSFDVLMIMWGAFLLYKVTDTAGAITIIGRAIPRLTDDRGVQALLVGWVFPSFLQGLGGFGVPVAVTAPLLVGLGFSPLQAVVIPSIGHAWAVTFGSLGAAFQALRVSSGLSGAALAPAAAAALGCLCLVSGWGAAHASGARLRSVRMLGMIFVLACVMGAAQFALATSGLWGLASFGGSSIGLAVGYWLAKRSVEASGDPQGPKPGDVFLAFVGYLILVVLAVVIEFDPAVHGWLSQPALTFDLPATTTALGFRSAAVVGRTLALVSHPGMVLVYSAGLTYGLYRIRGMAAPGDAGRIVRGTVSRMGPSTLGILAMVAMAEVMTYAGMTDSLAAALAAGFGKYYPWVAPWIGALGAFMTGSNTNSNAVLAALQFRTSEILGLPAAAMLAAQTAGGAFGSVIAPAKLIVGASTAGLVGNEGLAMRRLGGYVLLALALTSLGVVAALAVFS